MDALGKVTSSLTTHVLRSSREQGRDPAEQVLQDARAHYGESERQIQFRCDGCGLLSPGSSSEARAVASARALGWTIDNSHPDCPAECLACRPDAPKLLPGQVAASIPEALLSSPERIFCDRMVFLWSKVESRTSPRALLINSRTSGHRTMLTDFAISVGYDVEQLEQKSKALEGKQIELPKFGDPEKAREWFRGLFELLKMEDSA